MARVKVQEPKKSTLEELIPVYGEQNAQCNALKKTVADLNSKLKTAIHDAKQENKDIVIDGWKCTLSVSEDVKVNEERMIEVAKQYKIPIVKKREYIDFEALEKLIYAGKLGENVILEIDKCNEKVSKETLRCSKMKESKNGD